MAVFRALMKDDGDEDIERQLRASFGRMRSRHADAMPAADPPQSDDAAPDGEPSVPAKLFIGPNATWYDDRWRWMDWRGKSRSWNGAAAFTFGAWFAYRRMYRWLALYLVWMAAFSTALMAGVPAAVPLVLQGAVMVVAGLYGNTLYLQHFRRVAREVARRETDHAAQLAAIAAAGGVTPHTAYAVPIALVAMVVAIGSLLELAGLGPTLTF